MPASEGVVENTGAVASKAMEASPVTLCGSLSLHPVSLGKVMHDAAYATLGLSYVYVPFATTSDELAAALGGMRALGIRGFGVSMPFKLEIAALCDELSPGAVEIGAVNTIVNEDGWLRGHNTDALGAVRAIEEGLAENEGLPTRSLAGARCLLLGAGGAARAVAHGLAGRGAVLTIANRDEARGAELATRVGATAISLERARADACDYPIIVNATSLGMQVPGGSGATPFPEDAIGPGQLVMDIVYKPIDTDLVLLARRRGATVVNGGRMLLHQAAGQFELYTGLKAPLGAMDRALRTRIG